jgi:hypothetical protein
MIKVGVKIPSDIDSVIYNKDSIEDTMAERNVSAPIRKIKAF